MKRAVAVVGGLAVVSMLMSFSGLSLFYSFGATAQQPLITPSGRSLNGQPYSGTLEGNTLWTNNSFPFQNYVGSSQILSLSAVKSDLSSYAGISDVATSNLRPYLSLYPSEGNPYDFSQGMVGNNNTIDYVYEYIIPTSGLIIGFWITSSSPQQVVHVFTYHEQTVSIAASGYTQTSYSPNTATGNPIGVGFQTYESGNGLTGAILNTGVHSSGLYNPSPCSTNCWQWGDTISMSDYNWVTSHPSNPWLTFAVLAYWGGTVSQSSTVCSSSSNFSPYNCNAYVYYQGSTTANVYLPGVGGWTSGNSVQLEWTLGSANCLVGGIGSNYYNTWNLLISDTSTGTYSSYTVCSWIPENYAQFLEQRPQTSTGGYYENPNFGSFSFSACLTGIVSGQGACTSAYSATSINPSGSTVTAIDLYNSALTTLLVSSSALTSGSYSSSWHNTWYNSGY